MKKLLLIAAPLVAIGAVVALAMLGIIQIPGLSPAKADWKATLLKIYSQRGSLRGNLVVLKDAPKPDVDSFLAAAKAGGLDPVAAKEGITSPKLVDWIAKNCPAKPQPPKPTKPTSPAVTPPTSAIKPPKQPEHPEAGAETVAELWNAIETKQLLDITKAYKDAELAKILLKMETGKVSEYLSALKSDRAAKLSREIQKQASLADVTQ